MKQQTKFKQTEIGKIPEDWDVKTLEDISKYINRGLSPNYSNEGIPVINQKCVRGGSISLIDVKKHNKNVKFPTDKMLKNFDIVINSTGVGTLGRSASVKDKLKEPTLADSHLTIVRVDEEKVDPLFVAYFLNKVQKTIENMGEGTSGQQELSREQVKKLFIPIPKINEQQSIAKILSHLDAKIELNNQMNKTLEAIGQALFKRWFVDEKKKEWKKVKLGDLIENVKYSLKPGENLRNRNYVPIDCLPMRRIGLNIYLPFTEAKSSLIGFEKDDILIGAMRVYFHRVNLSPFKGVTRTTTFVLRPKDKDYLSFCLFLLNMDDTIDFANAHSKGSTMPYAVWNNSLENMPLVIPEERRLKEFNKLVYPIISKLRDTVFENQYLNKIRDSLLPKLMSGEIRVK